MKQLLAALLIFPFALECVANTTINSSNKFAYGANIGWVNGQADSDNGVNIGQFYLTGNAYGANVGWISFGNAPTNGFQYDNLSADDFGVNHDQAGALSGFAYGANIGWIHFEQTQGQPKVDLNTGSLSGSVYGANVGWIGLSNLFAFVQTDTLDPGPDTDADGIPDAWEQSKQGNLTDLSGGNDFDLDGVNDEEEYASDTDPDNANAYLRITQHEFTGGTSTSVVTWTSEPTRKYYVEVQSTLSTNWVDSGLGQQDPDGATTTRDLANPTNEVHFIRARALVPLSP